MKDGCPRWGEELCVEEKRRKGWRGENGLWEKRENECAVVGEKGRRMSALQWGRRGEE